MYSRFLFVGLGGSGGKTLRFLKSQIERWLEKNCQPIKIPDSWQFLHIDTPEHADGQEIDHIVDQLAPGEYLGLTRPGREFSSVQRLLDGDPSIRSELATWRVDPTALNVPMAQGAGQFRAIGQTLAMAYASMIRERLVQSLQIIDSARSRAELGELYSNITSMDADVGSNTYVIVVSSLAGGTGSGLLNVVCDILRAESSSSGENTFAILYTPETFRSLDPAARGGIQANSLAAICELLNGYWWGGSSTVDDITFAPPVDDGILRKAGCGRPITRSGPAFPFLVGARNSNGVDHGTFDQLYEMVGRSLLSWVTDRQVQAKFIAYTTGNWENSARSNPMGPILVDAGETQEVGYPPFSALGFSRLSVGTEYFEKYAMERLTRDAYDHLVNYHVDSDEARQIIKRLAQNDPETTVAALADSHIRWFQSGAKLSEYGPEDNQIIDGLRPNESDELHGRFVERTCELAGLGQHGEPRSLEDWRYYMDSAIEEAFREYQREYEVAIEGSTELWISDIQKSLGEAVEKAVINVGLKVTAKLCRETAIYLAEHVYEDLMQNDYERYRDWANTWHTEAAVELEGVSGRIAADDERLRAYVSASLHYRQFSLEAFLAKRAAEMAREASKRLVSPIGQALEDAWFEASRSRIDIPEWASWQDAPPPKSEGASSGEFTLFDSPKYPELFTWLLSETFSENSRTSVRELVIGSQFDMPLLDIEKGWFPELAAAQHIIHTPSFIAANVNTKYGDLRQRARIWLNREGSPFGQFLNLSFRKSLTEADTNSILPVSMLSEFRRRFLAQLRTAIDASAPLIDIDQSLVGLVHPGAQPKDSRHYSAIPLSGLPIYEDVKSVLLASGEDPRQVEEWFTTDEGITHIDITSSFEAPRSLLVMRSLLKPIADDWDRSTGNRNQRQFWSHRRARPLRRFVPCSQALLVCLVRGWFIGRLLGMIDAHSRPVRIARNDQGPVSFPIPFLPPRSNLDILAAVLESLPLAYVEASRKSSLDSFKPYIRLQELGMSIPGGGLWDYDKLGSELEEWVSTGKSSLRICDSPLREYDDRSSQERLRRLIDILEETIRGYTSQYEKQDTNWHNRPSSLSSAHLWTGIWQMIERALRQIQQAAEDYGEGQGRTPLLH